VDNLLLKIKLKMWLRNTQEELNKIMVQSRNQTSAQTHSVDVSLEVTPTMYQRVVGIHATLINNWK
jgi:hypothetical protein